MSKSLILTNARPSCWILVAYNSLSLSASSQNKKHDGSETAMPKPFRAIPGPKPAPFIGNLWRYLPVIGELDATRHHVTGARLRARYGDLVREVTVPGRTLVHVFDPKDMQTLFRQEGRHPVRLSHRALLHYRQSRPHLYSTGGLFPTNGPEWRRLRTLVQRPMLSPGAQEYYARPLELITDDLIRRLDDLKDTQGMVPDALDQLYQWALECTGQIALNKRLGCLRSDGEPSEEAQQLITAAADTHHAVMITENRLPIWKYSTTLSYSYRTLVNAQDTMARIVLRHLDEALTASSNTEPECVNASVLHQFASTPDLSKADIFTMILDMFLAGIDTTAYSTAFALYHLAKNMDKQMLLRKELVSLLPSKDTPLTLPIIQESHFLRACVKESLRLHPIAIGVGRVVPEDIVLSGYKVPKQTIVITQNQVACRSAHFSQPDRFLPERWIRGQELEEKTHPFLFLPFGYGPRSCIGKRFALLEMHLALAKNFLEHSKG